MSKWIISVIAALVMLSLFVGVFAWLVSIGLEIVAIFLPEIVLVVLLASWILHETVFKASEGSE